MWRWGGGYGTGVEVEFDVCVFFFFVGVVVWSAFDSGYHVWSLVIGRSERGGWWTGAYTWTFRNSMLAVGVCGEMITESAMRVPMQKATVVKKPKTFWARTREECILVGWLGWKGCCNVVRVGRRCFLSPMDWECQGCA